MTKSLLEGAKWKSQCRETGRAGSEPKIVAKHQTRWTGFDDKV